MADLLFELYVEELPASYLDKAIDQLETLALEELTTSRLGIRGAPSWEGVHTTGTPRRLVLHVPKIPDEQQGEVEQLIGPPVSAAFKDGKPTKAAEAFAAKLGVPLEKVEQKDTPKGRYLVGTRVTPTRRTTEILPEVLVRLLARLEFPKSMVWVPGSKLRFPRPLRSIVALLGAEVVPLEWNGVRSGRATWGHPFLAPGAIELASASWDDYARALEAKKVVIDREARRERIQALVKKELGSGGPNEKIVAVTANLVEWPEVMTGEFEKRFLEIPAGVIVSAIEHHLRAFPLRDKQGNLTNRFAFVCNRPPHEVIRQGNERVLRARLSDAHFFYEKDQKTPLKELAQKLKEMVFQRELGSYWEKQERVKQVALQFDGDAGAAKKIEHAATIMKADLVTEVVGEFPELQGEVGAVYARKQGWSDEVAEAIREAYLPKGEGDALPETPTGIALSLGEKLDNVVSAFATGMKPTGSKDPLGVRRQVIGILRILRERKIAVPLSKAIETAARLLPQQVLLPRKKADAKAPAPDPQALLHALVAEVREFAKGRLETIAKDEGHRLDLVGAVLAAGAGFDNVPDFWARLSALEKLAQAPRFKDLVQLVERTRNISKDALTGDVDSRLLTEAAEKELHKAYADTRGRIDEALLSHDYAVASDLYAKTFTAPVERFMNEVFVNDKNEAIRKNRLSLLKNVHLLLAERFADLAEVVVAKS